MAETEKPKKKLSDYFSDMHIALGKSYSPPGGASILFAGEGFSTDWKQKYVNLSVCVGELSDPFHSQKQKSSIESYRI